MLIDSVACRACGETFIVEAGLGLVKEVRLHCPSCTEYFELSDAPPSLPPETVTNASVPITIWEPTRARDFRTRD